MTPGVSRKPPYLQISEHYQQQIQDGELAEGDRLPTVAAIAEEWDVAHATAAKVIRHLQAEGLITASPRGSFVTSSTPGIGSGPLNADKFAAALHDFKHTAFRLELQDTYLEDEESEIFRAWQQGSDPLPTMVPELEAWYARIHAHVREGKRIARVRVQQDPPTTYQRFERYLDYWNRVAGEDMRYITVSHAYEIGLLPAAGRTDWWLLDSQRLIVMHFDDAGHRIRNELVTDPKVVVQACAWRDLAMHYSTRLDE